MIIGNGMMAKQFAKYQHNREILIFASGVSNSKETREKEFHREAELLKTITTAHSNMHLVYFGTSNMYNPVEKNSVYVQHKLEMERYIAQHVSSYHIFRVTQVIGRANNQTLVNYLIKNIIHDKEFEVWSRATRNLIALTDVFAIIDYIVSSHCLVNQIINVANPQNIPIAEFICIIEKVIGKKARIKLTHKGYPFDHIDISAMNSVLEHLQIKFDREDYYARAIENLLFGYSY